LKESKNGWAKLLKSLAIIFFIYGVILFVGVFSGSRNFFYPLENTSSATSVQTSKEGLDFIKVSDLNDLQERIKNAKQPVMVDFYADWCVNCKELEQFTFSDTRVQERLKSFLLLKVDVTKNSQIDKAMMKHFGIFGPPALLFFQDEKEAKNLRIVGFKNADEFLKHIKSL
jgi:thiol:disulfide interchange protein DsbD